MDNGNRLTLPPGMTLKRLLGAACVVLGVALAYGVASYFRTGAASSVFIVLYAGMGLFGLAFRTASAKERRGLEPTRRNGLLLNAGFFSLLAASIALLPRDPYKLTTVFYDAATGAGIVLFMQIWYAHSANATHHRLIFMNILTYGILLRAAFLIVNPLPIGQDVYVHANYVQSIFESSGKTTPQAMGHYFYFPAIHMTSSALVFFGFSYIGAFQVAELLLAILILPAAFLVGLDISHNQVFALLCMFLAAVSVFALSASVTVSVLINSMALILLAIHLTLRYQSMKPATFYLLFGLLALMVFFMHPFAAFILIVWLLALRGVEWLIPQGGRGQRVIFSYVIAFVAYLTFVDLMLFNYVTLRIFNFESILGVGTLFQRAPSLTEMLEIVVGLTPICILFGLGVRGIRIWMAYPTGPRIATSGSIIALHAIPFAAYVGGIGGLEPVRYLAFTQFLLLFPAATAMVACFDRYRTNLRKAAIICVVGGFVFTSSTSYLIGIPNELDNAIRITPIYLTQSTLVLHHFLNSTPVNSTISLDGVTWRYLVSGERGPLSVSQRLFVIFDVSEPIMGYLVVNSAYSGFFSDKTTSEVRASASMAGARIYDSGPVSVYVLS